ncbi:chain-length determining protein [Alkalimonas amylolytica]|uniref:Capsular polysaccharide transport system permease protein n=1 Tax=Alkalimonas amylolytica TaxID=152573 RepID=A0A1H4A2N2_ALKAM|nr:chain-length determining protein [Alkalimonas amylolytica]SEA30289.1 capsular polysaccharide transport system permease protein [Alkalimonas amylolytica]
MNKLQQHPQWGVALVVILVSFFYWMLLATDRYVSEANIVLKSPEISPASLNFSSILSGTSGAGDLLLLRDHMLSVDMLNVLEERLHIRQHFASKDIDRWSRLSSEDAPIEKFHRYMQKRIDVHFDDYANVLRLRVQAYTPEMAQRIAKTLLQEGELHMNRMGQRLAEEQVAFIEGQVEVLERRLYSAREALLTFQNTHGLVSPTGSVESIMMIVAQLEAQKALLEAQRKASSSFQSSSSPEILRLDSQIQALNTQIQQERNKMATADGDALNRISAEFETLTLQAQFALELYSNSLLMLETTRVEAARKLKQVSVLQYPTMAQYSVEPRRSYNFAVVCFFVILLAGIAQLTRAIIRDHLD